MIGNMLEGVIREEEVGAEARLLMIGGGGVCGEERRSETGLSAGLPRNKEQVSLSSGEKFRRDKGQLSECFDFLRGRCYHGAFCRYMYHDKSDGARCYRSKQQHVDVPPVSRTSDFDEETENPPPRRSVHDQDMPGSSFVL